MTEHPDWLTINPSVIESFRANAGVVGGPLADRTLLLLHTTGSVSGLARVHPLTHLPVGEDYAVFASDMGSSRHPAWYHNVVADPEVRVELGNEEFPARAIVVEGSERDRLYALQVERYPHFKAYEDSTDRTIPVVLLRRISPA